MLALAACGAGDAPSGKAFHVVVISTDGWQPDGSGIHRSQFAKTSTTFDSLEPTIGSALQVNAAMWTGLSPSELEAETRAPDAPLLAPEQILLPEYLIDHGYRTSAVVATDSGMTPESGLTQGFDTYQSIPGSAVELSVLADDWIGRHRVQPFFLFLQFPSAAGEDAAVESSKAQADEGLGIVLKSLGTHGLLDSSLIVLTGHQGAHRLLQIKAPGQRTALTDSRPVEPHHMPQLLLQHMSLPVAAVRPNAYLRHPIEALTPGVGEGSPQE
jgi:arylsulfatase A-like enzyme